MEQGGLGGRGELWQRLVGTSRGRTHVGNVLEKTSKCHEEWHCGGQQQLQLMKNTVRSKSLRDEDLQRRKLSGGVLW